MKNFNLIRQIDLLPLFPIQIYLYLFRSQFPICKRKDSKEEGKRGTQLRILTTTDSRILGFLQPEIQTQGIRSSAFFSIQQITVHIISALQHSSKSSFFLREAERMRKRLCYFLSHRGWNLEDFWKLIDIAATSTSSRQIMQPSISLIQILYLDWRNVISIGLQSVVDNTKL